MRSVSLNKTKSLKSEFIKKTASLTYKLQQIRILKYIKIYNIKKNIKELYITNPSFTPKTGRITHRHLPSDYRHGNRKIRLP